MNIDTARTPASRSARRPRRVRLGVEGFEARTLLSGLTPPVTPVAEVAMIGASTVPLIDLGAGQYQGEPGGLYGDGSNTPPDTHAVRAALAAALIRPLDRLGRPDPRGKVGMLAIGQSTTWMIFAPFQQIVRASPEISPVLTTVNAGQDGMVLQNWSREHGPWKSALGRVRAAGLSPKQVQVLWIDLAQIGAWKYGDFPGRQERYADDLARVVSQAKRYFPNASLAFVSSRIYGGYGPGGADPEPYAYESAFGVRRAIERQTQGDPKYNPDPAAGPIRAPILLWGPYLWSDGPRPSSTGLAWDRADLAPDGIHPSNLGSMKAAAAMFEFFTTDRFTRDWFLA